MSQGVRLTDLGRSVADEFSQAFDRLGEAVIKLRASAGLTQIRIAVLPSIAQLWLSHRLPLARSRLPQVTISITAMDTPPNLLREPFDLAIFFAAPGTWPHAIEVCGDAIYPVCAPALAPRLRRPEDLAGHPLLHDTLLRDDWPRWLAEAAPAMRIDASGPSFSLYSLALQEAQNGAGILMGHEPLVRASLDDGSLVAPFEQVVNLDHRLIIAAPYPVRAGSLLDRIINTICQPGESQLKS